MPKVKVDIDIRLKFYSAFFIGGGKGNSEVDLYALKDINGIPYIPGSSIKGKLRYMTTMVHNKIMKEKCKANDDIKCNCPVCSMFGGKENNKGSLRFSGLYFDDISIGEKIINVRNGIKLNRFLGCVEDQSLYNYETVESENNTFNGKINGYLDEKTYKKQLLLLFLGFSMLDTIGGMQSKGIGWLDEAKEMIIYVNGEEISSSILNEWRNELEVQD
ncbi:MAG: RAMP superfamily CRISPR-associated protein [Clostridium sp.]|nr:RAMP superfamily CRISPR-associated protein [Clostridium sp.]